MVAVVRLQWLPTIARDRPRSHRTIQFDSTNLSDPAPSHIAPMSCDSFSDNVVRIQLYHFLPYICISYHNRFRFDPPAIAFGHCTSNGNRPIPCQWWWWHPSMRWSVHLLMLAPSVTTQPAALWGHRFQLIAFSFLLIEAKISSNLWAQTNGK